MFSMTVLLRTVSLLTWNSTASRLAHDCKVVKAAYADLAEWGDQHAPATVNAIAAFRQPIPKEPGLIDAQFHAMKRGYEDVGAFSGTRRRTGDQGLPRAKFGLKALLPDAFASFLLRDRGSAKEQLQEESGARLVFSNKGDFFPDTLLRVLGVFSDTAEAVMMALDLILGKIGELAEDERSRPPPAGCEMLGEEGEFIFRLILPRDLTGLLIGNQGANIKQLRRESGAKAKASIQQVLPGYPAVEQSLLRGLELLVLRQPRMNLSKFVANNGLHESDDPSDLDSLLSEAGRKEEPNVCLEIVCHPNFGRFEEREHRENKQRSTVLLNLLLQPLFPAFETLVQHEAFGQIPGMLDEAAGVLHSAASTGLADHCRCLLQSPHFREAACRKANYCTALHHAANAEILRILLQSPALSTAESLNAQDRFGCTLLHYVTSEEMCQVMLGHPNFTAINKEDASGQTALHCAKNPGICATLLEHGAACSLSVADSLGRTPLHTLSRNPKVLAVLFRSRAGDNDRVDFDINALDKRGRSALHYATSAEACAVLFQAGFGAINALDDCGMSALHTATAKSLLGVVRAVIEHPDFSQLNAVARADYCSDTALSRAASLRNSELVLELLQHGGHDSQSLQKAADFAQGLTEAAREKLLAALDEQLKATKIVIRDDTVAGHRFITLSGVPESLSEALRRITEYMHQESGSDEFQQYLRVINFNDAGAHEGSGGQWNSDGQGKGGYRQPPPAVRMESKAFTQAPDGLHLLGEDLAMLPRGAAEMSYSVSCVLPAQLVPALIGKAGELVRSIQDRTGAKIDISRDSIPGKDGLRKMECIGPLLSIYSAHTLMMQRLQEVEQTPPPARRPERTSSPHRRSGHRGEAKDGYPSDTRTERQKELEAMVADLEKKLSEAKAMKQLVVPPAAREKEDVVLLHFVTAL
ncbi:unnamed protein product [Symbiodinium microadriaticum]|nr:unnamed protein product [Symbiodinium microadriaticum]